jgi:hypothetical protein
MRQGLFGESELRQATLDALATHQLLRGLDALLVENEDERARADGMPTLAQQRRKATALIPRPAARYAMSFSTTPPTATSTVVLPTVISETSALPSTRPRRKARKPKRHAGDSDSEYNGESSEGADGADGSDPTTALVDAEQPAVMKKPRHRKNQHVCSAVACSSPTNCGLHLRKWRCCPGRCG